MTTVDTHSQVEPIYFPLFLFISFVVLATITLIVLKIIHDRRHRALGNKFPNFLDMIRDGDYYPSLPRFQFLVWTLVISFVYLSTYLIRIYSGKFDAPYVDNNLLILLGVSIVSPLLSNIISGYKYSRRLSDENIESSDITNLEKKSFKSMLFESGKPALFRYQMFLWTFVGVFIFLSVFVGSLHNYTENYVKCQATQDVPQFSPDAPCKEIESLSIPKIDSMLVVLMGLSQSGYLGGKIVARSPARITKIYKDLENKKLIILGLNLGDKSENNFSSGTILINDKVVAGHSDKDVKWFDTKIEFPLPDPYKDKEESFRVGLIIDDVIEIEKDYLSDKETSSKDSKQISKNIDKKK